MQHDMNLANQTRTAFRSDLNNALQSLASLSSGATAPSTTFAYMLWADTTSNQLKRRNAANSGWEVMCTLDETRILTRSSNTILGESDRDKTLIVTGGYTQTLTAVATLGDDWKIDVIVDTGVTLILDPNSTETIDGATTKTIVGPASGRIVCNGSLFRTVGIDSAPNGELRSVQVISPTGANTWTKPAGLRRVKVRLWGAGGGGGGGNTSTSNRGSGGGAGGYSEKLIEAAALGSTETATIGAGGTGGADGSPGNNGTSGGTTSFGAHCSATGGAGGNAGSASGGTVVAGVAGGAGSGGDINLTGSDSDVGNGFTGGVSGGGTSPMGGGRGSLNVGSNGKVPGGGAACGNHTGGTSGGTGGNGFIIVEEFY